MIEDTIFTAPTQIDDAVLNRMFTSLTMRGVFDICVDEGIGPKRMVFVALREDRQIMVAMEGSGCLFLDADSNINPFVFVTGGFQFKAAHIAAAIFVGLAKARANLNETMKRAYPQLEDKRS